MGTSAGNIGRKMYSDSNWRARIAKTCTLKRLKINKACICGKLFIVERTIHKDGTEHKRKQERRCCSTSCSNRYRKVTKQTRIKISNAAKRNWLNEEYRSKLAKALCNNRRFTSKGEVELRSYFINNFPDSEWTFGGNLRVNGEGIVRDLYSNKLKACIEYDGIWHFKDINGQLKRKQLKDKLLEQWCKDNGYKLIRITEEEYLKDKELTIKKILKQLRVHYSPGPLFKLVLYKKD
jgi:very-short-patch-repair endonuclease